MLKLYINVYTTSGNRYRIFTDLTKKLFGNVKPKSNRHNKKETVGDKPVVRTSATAANTGKTKGQTHNTDVRKRLGL
jgi:hypothetical protein